MMSEEKSPLKQPEIVEEDFQEVAPSTEDELEFASAHPALYKLMCQKAEEGKRLTSGMRNHTNTRYGEESEEA